MSHNFLNTKLVANIAIDKVLNHNEKNNSPAKIYNRFAVLKTRKRGEKGKLKQVTHKPDFK